MGYLNAIGQFLKKPFPKEESFKDTLKIVIPFSLFVTFFLYTFQPNGINTLESNNFLYCLGFGSITFFTSIIYEYFIVKILKLKGQHYNFGKWILYLIGVIFMISLANFIYARLAFFGYIDWAFFPAMIKGTLVVGIIPCFFLGIIGLMHQEKKYQNIAAEINQKAVSPINNKANNDLFIFNIPISQIRYIEALQNYVKIGHFNVEGQLMEQTERATLKGILDMTQGKKIVKCHRSYLVNQEAIISASGNAQGLLLSLSDCDKTIPVSRSFVSHFRKK